MWLRTREIKPGVYETQSAGRHLAGQVGIAFGVLLRVIGLVYLIINPVENLAVIVVVVLVGGPFAYWHYSYRKTHRDEDRERRPGPWNSWHSLTGKPSRGRANGTVGAAGADRGVGDGLAGPPLVTRLGW